MFFKCKKKYKELEERVERQEYLRKVEELAKKWEELGWQGKIIHANSNNKVVLIFDKSIEAYEALCGKTLVRTLLVTFDELELIKKYLKLQEGQ